MSRKDRKRNADTKLIVPVSVPVDQEHGVKYFILNEEPKGYICEKGCVHEYPSKYSKGRPVRRTLSPITMARNEKPDQNPALIAYRYVPPGKTSASHTPPLKVGASYTPLRQATEAETIFRKYVHNTPLVKRSVPNSPSDHSSLGSISKTAKYLKSPIKMPKVETFVRNFVEGNTQTHIPTNITDDMPKLIESPALPIKTNLASTGSHQSLRIDLDRTRKASSSTNLKEIQYDKHNSNVFARLYPYKSKAKQNNSDEKKGKDQIKRPPIRMTWTNYHRLDVIHEFMDEMEALFPSLCTVGVIGQSIEGRNIKLLKISNGNANNSAVWMDAGIHAREWIAPAVNTFIANHIARNFDKLPESCTNKDWYFLPVVNPDGYEYTHTDNRMWRKNRAWVNGKCVGVDLNRNFSVAWGGKGSSSDPNHCFYRGAHAFSEPESCAMRSILRDANLPFKVYITLHAFGEVIIFPFAHSEDLCPDYIRLLKGATVMSRAIYDTDGTTYKVGVSKDVMYQASGTSNDYSYGALGIPYCYLIELRNKKHKFLLPEEEIKQTSLEILNCVKALMAFVDSYPLDQNSGDHNKHGPSQGLPYKDFGCFLVVNIWKEEPSTMDVMVEGPRVGQLAGLLHEREIPYSVAITDISDMILKERGAAITKVRSRHAGTMDWKEYHRLDTIYAFMENLAREYPYLVTLQVIGKSVEGRNLLMMKISNGNSGNTGVWIDGAIHCREWISAAVVTYLANVLVRTYHDLPSSVTNKDWYILPVLNPDGYEYTHTHDRMWRKNRARYGECVGVDLNRNFGYGWGQNGEEGSSDDPGNIFFRGPAPFSEPESMAVRNAIVNADVPFRVFLSFHSYGEVVIFPWGYTGEPCPTYVELLEGGTAMAKAIFEATGRTYKVGSTKDLMYYAAGTSIDWAYGSCNIPYSYMLELRGKKHRFLLPKNEILSTSQEVWSAVLRLMDFVDQRCRSTQTCVCHK